jgi:hypothetical protein
LRTQFVSKIAPKLAARAAAEVRAGDEDPGAAPRVAVQDEVGRVTVLVDPLVVERVTTEAPLLRQRQEARGEDDVGVDIGVRQRRRDRLEDGERGHRSGKARASAR